MLMVGSERESDEAGEMTSPLLTTAAHLADALLTRLLEQHRQHLYASGLTDETIAESGMYSETDPYKLQKILRWKGPSHALVPALVIPFRNLDGTFSDYARVRPDRPRPNGGKYESPAGSSNRAYFSAAAIAAINNLYAPIGLTEGEKKKLAACQAGLACIGITGVWNWQQGQSADAKANDAPRELIDDLAGINWKDRPVWICFDTDPRRNPSVNQALAELAAALTRAGAIVTIIELPPGPPDEQGIPTKMAIDDFIVAYGEAAFRELVQRQMEARHVPPMTVEQYQKQLQVSRVDSLQHRGVAFLDRSPTGSGKSTADVAAMKAAGTSLTVLATHRNCEEKVKELCEQHHLFAAKYPKLDAKTCARFDVAEAVIGCGLSVSAALCPTCEYRTECPYQLGMHDVEIADHRVATHKRAELCLESITDGRVYIALHEDPISILRPMSSISASLQTIISVAATCRRDLLDWNPTEALFYWNLECAALFLEDQLATADETTDLELPDATSPPPTAHARLWKKICQLNAKINGEAMRACLALASGQVASLCVRVDTILEPGAEAVVKRSIIVLGRTWLPTNATVWIADATADRDEIASLCNLPVIESTPGGTIQQLHPVLQIPIDLKKGTAKSVFVKTVRAVLARYPKAQRIGVICDRAHLPALNGTAGSEDVLSESERARISKLEYFRGGEGRGSNSWLEECDLLLVLGTPRVPPHAIKSRLIRGGKTAAAARSAEWVGWGPDYWAGTRQDGQLQVVRTLAYRDRDWHRAYQSTVRAELTQCIGRGRSIRENGIPTIVVTTEDLGVTLVDYELQTLTEFDERVLEALRSLEGASDTVSKEVEKSVTTDLSDRFPNIYIIGKVSVKCMQIVARLTVGERSVRRSLVRLEKAGCVRRVSERGGWISVSNDSVSVAPVNS